MGNPGLRPSAELIMYMDMYRERFLDRINFTQSQIQGIVSDSQNVHNTKIQKCVNESIQLFKLRTDLRVLKKKENTETNCKECRREINSMTSREKGDSTDTETEPAACASTQIIGDCICRLTKMISNLNIANKKLLLEMAGDRTVHSILDVTLSDVLYAVLQIIEKDFDKETQFEIYKCLDDEVSASDGKCFTGKFVRIINCLNGFSDLVKFEFAVDYSDVISMVIRQTKEKMGENYTLERHKELVTQELRQREVPINIIQDWLNHIE
jgi:hypothetical protein